MRIDLQRFVGHCSCGQDHNITVRDIYIEPNASHYIEKLLLGYLHPAFICDSNTKKAAASKLKGQFEQHHVIEITGHDIHADNVYVSLVNQQLPAEADIVIAVGAGTIHDLTRYVANERGLPFISIPTAASVDGFVSTVSAMTWNGMKTTLPGTSPLVVLADTDIFANAPYRLTASGISDLMAKYTALVDWKISHIITGEYFCPVIYELEMEALREVDVILHELRDGDPESAEKLMYALLLSGLAMQMIGNSRPASGAEHHISHLWEMSILNPPLDALHGEKVSVGLLLVLEKYEEIRQAIERQACRITDAIELELELLQEHIKDQHLYEGIMKENGDSLLRSIDLAQLEQKLPVIAEELRNLPTHAEMKAKLEAAGCITTMEQLQLPDIKSLTLAISPYVRRRLTLMRVSKLLQY